MYEVAIGCDRQASHSGSPQTDPRIDTMSIHALELIFTGLIVAVAVAVAWFAGYVVYKLYTGQR